MLIDTHCHLNFPDAFPDAAATVRRAVENGVEKLIVIGCDEESSLRATELSNVHENIYAVVGWHPNYAANYSSGSAKQIEQMLAHPKVVGIGEIGFDNHWDYATKEQQTRATAELLELATAHNFPVVFHCREAYPELLGWLESLKEHPPTMVLHCFSGDKSDMERSVQLGCYFGFDGPITYKKNDLLREIATTVPEDRILLETDSPYLSPHPYRGKPNEPAMVRLVAQTMADCRRISLDAVADLTTANALRAFPRLAAG
ncbi:MAG: TatD family hydrolase [Fimbriimonadales bacterium]